MANFNLRRLQIALWGGVGLTLVATIAAGIWARQSDVFADCRKGVIAGGAARLGGPFTLVDEDGATVTDTAVLTKPSLIYFGYSFCPDVCPLDNVRNAEAVALLAKAGLDAQPVFISIDPARDTPQVMKDYTGYLDDRLIGLTGSAEQVAAVARDYRVLYSRAEPTEGATDYLMSHTTMTYLVLPRFGTVEFFSRDEDAQSVATTTQCYLQHSDAL